MRDNSGRFDHFLRIGCGLPFGPQAEQAMRQLGCIVGSV